MMADVPQRRRRADAAAVRERHPKQQLVTSIAPVAVVKVYDGLALATGRSQMRVRNSAGLSNYTVKFTEVYIRRDGHWLLTAWQTKRIVS
jgi:hypothetical protein